jgi:hypothetical protein
MTGAAIGAISQTSRNQEMVEYSYVVYTATTCNYMVAVGADNIAGIENDTACGNVIVVNIAAEDSKRVGSIAENSLARIGFRPREAAIDADVIHQPEGGCAAGGTISWFIDPVSGPYLARFRNLQGILQLAIGAVPTKTITGYHSKLINIAHTTRWATGRDPLVCAQVNHANLADVASQICAAAVVFVFALVNRR